MAPEVLGILLGLHQDSYDKRVDLYRFGVVLWELFHCQIPYGSTGLDQMSIAHQVLDEEVKLKVQGFCPTEVNTLISDCLSLNPGQRPTFDEVVPLLSKARELYLEQDPEHQLKVEKASSQGRKHKAGQSSFKNLIDSAQELQMSMQEEMLFRWDFVFRQGFVVNKLFTSKVLRRWIVKNVKQQNIEMMILLSLLNQWLSPFLLDHSEAGVHSYAEEVIYFADLARGTPEIIDFLLDCNEDQVRE
jgi:serine/threonine protein kinase